MAIFIYSFTDDENKTAYYATASIEKDGKKFETRRFFENVKRTTARQWARMEETNLMILHDLPFRQEERTDNFNGLFSKMGAFTKSRVRGIA